MSKDLDEWFLSHQSAMEKIAHNQVRRNRKRDTNSVVNDYYIACAEKAKTGDFEKPKNPYGYFKKVFRSLVLREVRRLKRLEHIGEREVSTTEESPRELAELVSNFVESLNTEEQVILLLHEEEQFTLLEVAQVMDLSKSKVERRHVKIKSKIRQFNKLLNENGITVKLSPVKSQIVDYRHK